MVETIKWDIRRAGRTWRGDEAHERYNLTPEKFEMDAGKLFWTDEERVTLLASELQQRGPCGERGLVEPRLEPGEVELVRRPRFAAVGRVHLVLKGPLVVEGVPVRRDGAVTQKEFR